MKLTTHPFKSDLLTLTKDDLARISNGENFHVSGLYVQLEEESKPDMVYYGAFDRCVIQNTEFLRASFTLCCNQGDDIKLTFDGTTGKLKSAEVL